MIKFTGNLYWDGEKPMIQGRDQLVKWLSQFPADQWFSIDVTLIGSVNNTAQARLYFSWCDLIAGELGWNSGDEIHEYCKTTYNSGRSTKELDVKGWSEYMIKVQAFAGEHNITLPTGEA